MKNKKTLLLGSFALAAVLVVGQSVFASNDNTNSSGSMSNMRNGNDMSGMMQMMGNENMQKMMGAMNSPEGQKMMNACGTFMESYSDKNKSDSNSPETSKPQK